MLLHRASYYYSFLSFLFVKFYFNEKSIDTSIVIVNQIERREPSSSYCTKGHSKERLHFFSSISFLNKDFFLLLPDCFYRLTNAK